MSEQNWISFPNDFVWGAATSAYQIEGAAHEDGKGDSIWDSFVRQKGRVRTGETGEVATDHYHRWAQDVDLMAQLGLNAYRFSVAWTRILPQGKGQVNQAGLDFYSRLVDGLLAHGVTPYVNLFHYDLPQALQDQGGWANRDTAKYFGDYARIVGESLGDRVTRWMTHNEPWVTVFLGHLTGEHAPGKRNPVTAFAALHHVLLSHGYAVQAFRSTSRTQAQIGLAINMSPIYAAGPNDNKAVEFTDTFINRLILDPILKGEYPEDWSHSWLWRLIQGRLKGPTAGVHPDDLKLISAPLDYIGVNYYNRTVVKYAPVIQSMQIKPVGSEYSEMWEIYPQGMRDLLVRLNRDYGPQNWIVSENGVPVPDELTPSGVHDIKRIKYIRDHLVQIRRAMDEGVPVSGYFVWSLLDNFEWVHGYSKRFGIVYVDFKTLERTVKDSGKWYAEVIRNHGFRLEEPAVSTQTPSV